MGSIDHQRACINQWGFGCAPAAAVVAASGALGLGLQKGPLFFC